MTETETPTTPEPGARRTVLTAALFGVAGLGAAGAAVAGLSAGDNTAGSPATTATRPGAGLMPTGTSKSAGPASGAPSASASTAPSAPGSSGAASSAPMPPATSQTAKPVAQPSAGATRITVPKQAADAADRDESFALVAQAPAGPIEHIDFTPVDDSAPVAQASPGNPAPSSAAATTATASAAATATASAAATATASASATASAAATSAASTSAAATSAASTAVATAAGTKTPTRTVTAGTAAPTSATPAGTATPSRSVTAATAAPTSATASPTRNPGSVVQTVSATPRPTGGPSSYAAAAGRAQQAATVFGAAGPLSAEEAKAHLLRRATFGARPQDRADLNQLGVDGWIESQLGQVADPVGDAVAAQFNQAGTSIPQVVGSVARNSWVPQTEVAQMTLGRWIFSRRQLFEIVVDVFANLLNCTTPSDRLWSAGPDYHHQVIRKNAYGSYAAMLTAAMKHPAMLMYLSNDQSNRAHVNENLGRELLELHTVGVTGGYTEDDVVGSARILSGRTLDYMPQTYRFDPNRHYVGAVKVMGFSDPNTAAEKGEAMGDRYLAYLATLPATAQTVARKLAVRFVSDNPPQALIDRMAQAYLDNKTEIVPVLRTMFASEEFWGSVGQKTRRPAEDLVFSARALDIPADMATVKKGVIGMYWRLKDTGHAPLAWVPPNGYPDVAAAWQSSGQMLQQWSTHRALTGGWHEGMKPTTYAAEIAPRANETATAWVDRMGRYVLGGTLPPSARDTLIEFLGVPATSIVPSWLAWRGTHAAALILDSLYCQAR